jgi:hypothetical protein
VVKHGLIERGHATDHGHLVLQTVFDELTQEAEAVRTGRAEEDRVRAFDLCDVAAIVRRRKRREYLLDNLAAIIFEGALEAGAHFVAVGEIIGDCNDLLVLEFLGRVIGKRVGALRRCGSQPDEPLTWVALGHVLRGGNAECRNLLFGKIIGDRQRLERRERADYAMDVVLLDQLLRFGTGGCGNAGGIGHDQFHLAAGERIVAFLQKHCECEVHVDAARGERSGLRR